MATDKAIVIERAKRGSPRSLTRKRRGGPGAMLGAAILAALAGGVLVAGWAGAAPSDTRGTVRAVDITLLCSTVNVGGWREIQACRTPQRVVVRLRATLRSPGAWGVFGERRELRGIRRNVVTASVAVRTWPGRKPLSFATIDERGIARLWTSYDCT